MPATPNAYFSQNEHPFGEVRCLFLLLLGTLDLCSSPKRLLSVLALLACKPDVSIPSMYDIPV